MHIYAYLDFALSQTLKQYWEGKKGKFTVSLYIVYFIIYLFI